MNFNTIYYINKYIDESYNNAKNKGFWDDKPNIPTKLMLIVSELAEAFEYTSQENLEEEIADTYIRLCDMCGGLKINPNILYPEEQILNYSCKKEDGIGNHLMFIICFLSKALEADRKNKKVDFEINIKYSFLSLFGFCKIFNIDLDDAVDKKMEYNKKRKYKHGKKY